jgi:hypothetical protein
MSKEETLREMLAQHSRLPLERIQVCRDHSRVDISSLTRAVIYIFAAWSAPSVIAFQRLTEALASAPLSDLTIHLLDADDFSASSPATLLTAFDSHGASPHGYGESLWVRDGAIVAALSRSAACDSAAIHRLIANLSQ